MEARVLADASGAAGNRAHYFSSLRYATDNPDVIKILIEEIGRIDQWGEQQQIADTFFELGLVPKRVDVLAAAAPGLV